jgi:hypothetical protein
VYTRRKYSSGSGSGRSVGKGGRGEEGAYFYPEIRGWRRKERCLNVMLLGWKEGFVILLYVVHVLLRRFLGLHLHFLGYEVYRRSKVSSLIQNSNHTTMYSSPHSRPLIIFTESMGMWSAVQCNQPSFYPSSFIHTALLVSKRKPAPVLALHLPMDSLRIVFFGPRYYIRIKRHGSSTQGMDALTEGQRLGGTYWVLVGCVRIPSFLCFILIRGRVGEVCVDSLT